METSGSVSQDGQENYFTQTHESGKILVDKRINVF